MKSDASISPCQRFRYWLSRDWDSRKPRALFIMLNPSTADHKVNDAIIRKCIGFCQRFGFGGFTVINLSAFRSRQPADMFEFLESRPEMDSRELENLRLWMDSAQEDKLTVVCAWGSKVRKNRVLQKRVENIKTLCKSRGLRPMAIRIGARGVPSHPLMLPYSCTLKELP